MLAGFKTSFLPPVTVNHPQEHKMSTVMVSPIEEKVDQKGRTPTNREYAMKFVTAAMSSEWWGPSSRLAELRGVFD